MGVCGVLFASLHFHELSTGRVHYSRFLFALYLFIYLGFYVAFNTVQVISRQIGERKPVHTVGQGSVL